MLAPILLAATLALKPDPGGAATFDPERAIGATIDAHGREETASIFTPANTEAMLSAGFRPLSYRLATELDGEAWHWNPHGTWSHPKYNDGYWTSDDDAPAPIDVPTAYPPPRRGNTRDQSRNDNWSRIDDGDLQTFWKSNPYLDDRPQWVLIDLGTPALPDAIRVAWADPFAVDYDVQYWSGSDAINMPAEGRWITFPHGAIRDGHGDDVTPEIRYLRRRRRGVTMIEMGEEPDGQNMAPEDYAALFIKWSDRLHATDPKLKLGGPAFQSTRDVIAFWPEPGRQTSWMERFLTALRERDRTRDFAFFSFEWYPFDNVCADPRQQLLEGARLLANT